MYDIQFKNVSVHYDSVIALEDISFNVKEKSFLAIIGPNGGGKSTLLKALLKQVPLYSGQIEIASKSIGYVPQFAEFDQSFPISVQEVVLSGLLKSKNKFMAKYSKEEKKHASDLMDRLGIESLKNKQVGELSGGQLQKVLVARALIAKPRILLLDEPTASLDVHIKKEIYQLLKEFSQDVTIVIITHDMAEVFSFVTCVAYIDRTLHYHGSDSKMRENVFELTTGCPIEEFMKKEEALVKDFMDSEEKYDSSHI